MKKSYLVNDLVWIGIAAVVCRGGVKLGFGSFHQPGAGFMRVLSGLALGAFALVDLGFGCVTRWDEDREDTRIWADVNWPKLIATVVALFLDTALFSTLGRRRGGRLHHSARAHDLRITLARISMPASISDSLSEA